MSLLDQRHTVRFPLPDLIVRGRDHIVYAPVYLDGALVAPSSATVSVYNESGTAIVSAAPATVLAPTVARYTITAATTASLTLEERWRVEWAITLSTGVLYPRNDAALVRNGLWPVVTDADLYRRVRALDPNGTAPISAATNYQDELDEAWTEINLRLIALGNRPNLIMEPSALRQAHLYLSLALIFEGQLRSRLDESYRETAADYRRQYEAAWSALSPRYDVTDAGSADTQRRRMSPSVWLCATDGRST